MKGWGLGFHQDPGNVWREIKRAKWEYSAGGVNGQGVVSEKLNYLISEGDSMT